MKYLENKCLLELGEWDINPSTFWVNVVFFELHARPATFLSFFDNQIIRFVCWAMILTVKQNLRIIFLGFQSGNSHWGLNLENMADVGAIRSPVHSISPEQQYAPLLTKGGRFLKVTEVDYIASTPKICRHNFVGW